MRQIIVPVLAALSLAVLSTPAAAETVSIAVPYGDLDLSTSKGMATLDGRIEAATARICGRPDARRVRDGADHERCLRETQASVRLELARLTGNRGVLALNAARR